MPTVINDLIVEPAATPPAEEAGSAAAASQGTTPPGPEMERQVRRIERCDRERALRVWAH